ncbi:MAG TPA: SH3 domain-containing protein [Polyangia bacterium]|nr:SH3 domain-containing protein [Polyangia bacterium]
MTIPVRGLAAALLVAACALAAPAPARADDEALVRVLAEQASVHTGPGFAFRVVYVANRGEVFPVEERATRAHWFRVRLPDGTGGWILGDEVFPLDLEASDTHRGPSLWHRIGEAIFSPSPLLQGHIGLSFSAGVIGHDSAFLFRPALVFEPHISLEGFLGETVGNQIDVIYYGAGPNIFIFPTSPVTPFLGAAAGGASSRPKADQFTVPTGTYAIVNVGGGLLVALKKRITLRGDVRHYVLFDPNHTQSVEEYTGALSIVF